MDVLYDFTIDISDTDYEDVILKIIQTYIEKYTTMHNAGYNCIISHKNYLPINKFECINCCTGCECRALTNFSDGGCYLNPTNKSKKIIDNHNNIAQMVSIMISLCNPSPKIYDIIKWCLCEHLYNIPLFDIFMSNKIKIKIGIPETYMREILDVVLQNCGQKYLIFNSYSNGYIYINYSTAWLHVHKKILDSLSVIPCFEDYVQVSCDGNPTSRYYFKNNGNEISKNNIPNNNIPNNNFKLHMAYVVNQYLGVLELGKIVGDYIN